MGIDLDDIELAVVVNIEILREVLKKMSINGRRSWIASEPQYALELGSVTVAFGTPGCSDPLNVVLFRFPVLNTEHPAGGPDKLLVMLDSITIEQPGLYRDGDGVTEDEIADIEEFLIPLRRALVPVLAEYSGLDGRRWAGGVAAEEPV